MKKFKLLKKGFTISFLLITFFLANINAFAASFNYSEFNWEEFSKKNKNYWIGGCDENDDDCVDRILKRQEQFYTTLYKLLAEYQKRGVFIDDRYIIATVFFGLLPDEFADENSKEDEYNGQIHYYPYKLDLSDLFKYILGDDGDAKGAYDYFNNEKDTLKTLLNNSVGYTLPCYGISEPTNDDGTLTCKSNAQLVDGKCITLVSNMKATYWNSIQNKLGIFSSFDKDFKKECAEKAADYSSNELGTISSEKSFSPDFYFDYLKSSRFFDKKEHLKSYFETVLNKTSHKSMNELTEEEYEENKEEIEKSRERIINGIKAILEAVNRTNSTSFQMCGSNDYWWPIGSDETTLVGNVLMATGEPTVAASNDTFGMRFHPIHKRYQMHYGEDIRASSGKNVIASKAGEVVVAKKGSGYGNYVVIKHSDGNFTLYAHMLDNSLKVSVGDMVSQGQVIGNVGQTGTATGPHLHFEVRVGANTASNAQNPLNFIFKDNTRPKTGASTCKTSLNENVSVSAVEFIHSWEGSNPPKSGDNYVVESDGAGNPTVGFGVDVAANIDEFKARGYNPKMGDLIPISVVDEIENIEIQKVQTKVLSAIANAGITLEDYQIDALISRGYNYNISGFVDAYQKYGNTQALYDNFMNKPVTSKGKYLKGLERRREAEWELFHNGVYNLNH